ncbi:hypothetical protein DET61_12319 [Marinobacter nauticus]|uniref:DUF5675 domain-containing protein n=1 Tax=Marinobacter nauticus TaxID=2743 RepID=A0A368X8A2_MARNT|nr:DUF5675 family protein [Marinobacter nauticus]RCW62617.1 hypothetical protein DET61_12319 [Marinobacter nauticus]
MNASTSNHLFLSRAYTNRGVFGRLETPRRSYHSLELPWLGNRTSVSCIPEGVYTLGLRRSGVVERTTGGQYLHGWEVQDVPGRTYIMIHPANTIDDLEGCIAPGLSTGVLPDNNRDPQWAILNSFAAFKMLMEDLEARQEWLLDVRTFSPEWP